VIWTRASLRVSGFYSSGVGTFSGAWYLDDDEQGDDDWGGVLGHWNGVTLSGRWTEFKEVGTGYQVNYPLPSTYTLRTARALIAEDSGK